MTTFNSSFTGQEIIDALRTCSKRSKANVEAGKPPEGHEFAAAIMSTKEGLALYEALGKEQMTGIVQGLLAAFELLTKNNGMIN